MALITLLVHDKFQNRYLAANTHDAAYIIGGLYTKNLVAEFRDDQWAQLDDLNKARFRHESISVETQTMIVGGWDPK